MIGLFLGMVLVLLMHPVFTAKAVILPPQQGQSSAAMISQLGNLAALTGLGSGAGLKDPNDLYMGVLASNTVQDGLIKRLGLMDAYHVHKMSEARRILTGQLQVHQRKGRHDQYYRQRR